MYRFRVYNKSGQELQVRYTFYSLDQIQKHYDAPVFSEKIEIQDKKGNEIDDPVQYQFHSDSHTVSFILKEDQIATIGWGRNTTYRWLMELKERNYYSQDSFPPWINEFNLEKLWISSPDSQVYIREFMIDSLIKGKRKAESRLVVKK